LKSDLMPCALWLPAEPLLPEPPLPPARASEVVVNPKTKAVVQVRSVLIAIPFRKGEFRFPPGVVSPFTSFIAVRRETGRGFPKKVRAEDITPRLGEALTVVRVYRRTGCVSGRVVVAHPAADAAGSPRRCYTKRKWALIGVSSRRSAP